jgi:hypothetical protein
MRTLQHIQFHGGKMKRYVLDDIEYPQDFFDAVCNGQVGTTADFWKRMDNPLSLDEGFYVINECDQNSGSVFSESEHEIRVKFFPENLNFLPKFVIPKSPMSSNIEPMKPRGVDQFAVARDHYRFHAATRARQPVDKGSNRKDYFRRFKPMKLACAAPSF